MSTIVAFSGRYDDSGEHTELFVVHPANKEELRLTGLPSQKAHLNVAGARVRSAESAMWEWLEIGLTVVLGIAVFASTFLFLATAGNT
jgi:hypothetical protein